MTLCHFMTSSWCHTVFCAHRLRLDRSGTAGVQVCRLEGAASVQVGESWRTLWQQAWSVMDSVVVGIKRVTWRFWFCLCSDPARSQLSSLCSCERFISGNVWVESNITIQLQSNVLTNLHLKHFPVKWIRKRSCAVQQKQVWIVHQLLLSESVGDSGWRRPMKTGLFCCCDVTEANFSFGEGRSYFSAAAVTTQMPVTDTQEATVMRHAGPQLDSDLSTDINSSHTPTLQKSSAHCRAVPRICQPPPDVLSSPEVGSETRRVAAAKTTDQNHVSSNQKCWKHFELDVQDSAELTVPVELRTSLLNHRRVKTERFVMLRLYSWSGSRPLNTERVQSSHFSPVRKNERIQTK